MTQTKTIKSNQVKAFGTESPVAHLKPMNIMRREVLPQDVEIEILFCGVCHTRWVGVSI